MLGLFYIMAAATRATAAILLACLLAGHVQGCIELFGDSKDSLAAHTSATHWNYGFRGDDWKTGVDASGNPWVCLTGNRQSPLNLPHLTQPLELGPNAYRTQWTYGSINSNGTNTQVFNNGHTIQVQWAASALTSEVLITSRGGKVTDVLGMSAGGNDVVKRVRATPLQFHFHTDSEHAVDGAYFPLEMHIVHHVAQADLPGCPASGCYTVTGVMLALAEQDNPALDAIWEYMPEREGLYNNMGAGKSIDLNALLPADRTYISYEGSLTTPPCTEGLLWHVLTTPIPISLNQLRKYQTAVGLKDCTDGPAANATAPAATAGGRKMLSGHTHDHEESHGHKLLIQRGMKEGFQLISAAQAAQVTPVERGNGRTLLQAPLVAGEPVCEVVSFGFSNRNPQKANNRVIRLFTHPNSASLLGADAGAGTSGAADLRALTQATRDAVDDQKNLILGVGLGVGLGGTLLVLAALGAAVAVLKAGRSGSGAAHMDVHVAK
uniref:Carbonic anhydrase n=1 Tax=Chlamydomonas leiostraca TaxID=1034604 RepID=A0A7S0RK06_9CHLO